ncbi:glycosyltransferase family 2 protein [Actinomadura keratinilytica]
MSVTDPQDVRRDDGWAPDAPAYAVVVPTIGRECLADCLAALATADGPPPVEVLVVDDRPDPGELPLTAAGTLRERLRVLATYGRGPAAARNAGLREADAPWVVFLDDDVRVDADWRRRLGADLAAASPETGGVQGRLVVPLPADRRPTDWERGTAASPTPHGPPPTWPTGPRRCVPWAGSTSDSAGPSGRTPTWRSGCWARAGTSAAAGVPPAIRSGQPTGGSR